MDLDGDDAGWLDDQGFAVLENDSLGFGVVDGLDAVEPDLDAAAFGADAVVVPLADGFLGFGEDFGGGLGEDFFAAAFVVEGTVVAFAEVGLVAGDFVVIGDALGAELDAAVDEAFGAFELPFEGEFEVAVGFGGGEEIVFFLLGGEGASDEGAVFDAPDSAGVAFPAGEGFAVEEGDGVGAGGEGQGEKQQRCVVKTGHGKKSDSSIRRKCSDESTGLAKVWQKYEGVEDIVETFHVGHLEADGAPFDEGEIALCALEAAQAFFGARSSQTKTASGVRDLLFRETETERL